MSGHTAAPWIAASYSSVVGAPVVSASGRPIASVTYFQLGPGFENHERESAANGRLIAAAPELLEALKELFRSYKDLADSGDAGFWRIEDTDEGKQALAAIAKAEGQS